VGARSPPSTTLAPSHSRGSILKLVAASKGRVPSSFHALAVLVSGHPVGKGVNALTLQELGTRVDVLTERGLLSEARTAALAYHTRWAGPFMPLVFSLFALGVAAVSRGRSRSIAIGLAAPVATLVYSVLFIGPLGFGAWLPAFIVVWIPILALGAMTAVLLTRAWHMAA
jgi:lipopolysaccharide export LptBFGC system permease protein LptF